MSKIKVSKNELISEISVITGYTKHDINEVVNAYASVLARHLIKGESITIKEVATFGVEVAPPRIYKNLKTIGSVTVPKHNRVIIKPSVLLKEKVAKSVPLDEREDY